MAERLKDGADGKPLKFKQSTVSNLVEFLSNFSFRNVTDDRQLQKPGGPGPGPAPRRSSGRSPDQWRTCERGVQQGMTAARGGSRRHAS